MGPRNRLHDPRGCRRGAVRQQRVRRGRRRSHLQRACGAAGDAAAPGGQAAVRGRGQGRDLLRARRLVPRQSRLHGRVQREPGLEHHLRGQREPGLRAGQRTDPGPARRLQVPLQRSDPHDHGDHRADSRALRNDLDHGSGDGALGGRRAPGGQRHRDGHSVDRARHPDRHRRDPPRRPRPDCKRTVRHPELPLLPRHGAHAGRLHRHAARRRRVRARHSSRRVREPGVQHGRRRQGRQRTCSRPSRATINK